MDTVTQIVRIRFADHPYNSARWRVSAHDQIRDWARLSGLEWINNSTQTGTMQDQDIIYYALVTGTVYQFTLFEMCCPRLPNISISVTQSSKL